MPPIRFGILLPIIAVVLAACPAEVEDPEDGVAPPPETPETPETPDVAVCLEGEPFVADGSIPLEAPDRGDAHEVSDLRWQPHEGCERFVVDFAAEDGTPATSVGEVGAEVIRDLGVVRITARDVELVDPDATDDAFDGPLASEAFVMLAQEGRWVDVDLHLADEAEAHVGVLQEPARVYVDLRPGGGPIPPPAVTEEDLVVVLDPRPEGERSYPLTVTGYARTFEANVVVRLEQEGEEVFEDFTTATASADAWGHYELRIDDGPTGPIEVHVGEYSARDGTWQGPVVEVTMR